MKNRVFACLMIVSISLAAMEKGPCDNPGALKKIGNWLKRKKKSNSCQENTIAGKATKSKTTETENSLRYCKEARRQLDEMLKTYCEGRQRVRDGLDEMLEEMETMKVLLEKESKQQKEEELALQKQILRVWEIVELEKSKNFPEQVAQCKEIINQLDKLGKKDKKLFLEKCLLPLMELPDPISNQGEAKRP